MRKFTILLNKKITISSKTSKNSEKISETVWEHFNISRKK